MTKSILLSFATIIAFSIVSFAHAEEPTTTTTTTTTTPSESTAAPSQGMMEGKMDMKKMKTMMHECMETHKDGKMCEGQAMEECQKGKSHKECMKMMKKTAYKKSKTSGSH